MLPMPDSSLRGKALECWAMVGRATRYATPLGEQGDDESPGYGCVVSVGRSRGSLVVAGSKNLNHFLEREGGEEMLTWLKSLWSDEEGATMVEYALMLALIAIVCILVVTALGQKTGQAFNVAQTSLPGTSGQVQPTP